MAPASTVSLRRRRSAPRPGKARTNAAAIGARNVEFHPGELEHLPIADAAADVIVSNEVINLAPDMA